MPRCKFDAWLAGADSRVAIIGASGWVGAALADRVLAAAPDLPADRFRAFTTAPRALAFGDRVLHTQSLSEAGRLGDGEWLILHAGVVGAHRVIDGDPEEARRLNDALLRQVLAVAETGQVRRLVMMSSGGAGRPDAGTPAKAAYLRMKREHEVLVSDWGAKAGRAVLLPRLFNLGGPYITAPQYYALGDFILSLARTGRIAIGSGDPVVRDFTHVLEMAEVLLDIAVDDAQAPEPFDIGGAGVVELGDLAERVAAAFGLGRDVIDRPAPTGRPGDSYVAKGARYQAALAEGGRTPAPLAAIVGDTVAYMRQTGPLSRPA